MAVTALLDRSAGGSDVRNPVDVEIQSRPPEYGLGRHHPQAATGHGCITVLLLASVQNGGITIKERRSQVEIERDRLEKSVGLWFQRMGGCGSIHCRDCQHSEKVTSFIHGIDSSHSGFQCQSCGKITSLTGGGRGKANQYKESLICDCGGKFEREKMIFCPQCKSKNLSYHMEFIT